MPNRILIIDDEPDLSEIVQLAIDCFTDWQTDVADTGEKGIKQATTQPYDAILLDISMPDMDGFQVFETLPIASPPPKPSQLFCSPQKYNPMIVVAFRRWTLPPPPPPA